METLQPACYEFHRANYIIKPSLDKSTDTVLLTLNEGDTVLVVSVESSGWAFGIALDSGARGWIPTNYCERHAPALIHDLLKTLSCFLSVCDNEFTAETLADFDQKIKTTAAEIRLFLVSIILIIKVFSTHLPIRGQCTLSYTRISTCSDERRSTSMP
jgi:hypothetical protein